jgi:hypothetical protein
LIRETKANTKSSRSHIMFQLRLEKYNGVSTMPVKKAKMCLCDLAGSEKMHDDVSGGHKGGHFQEMKHINLSLTNLGKVIYNLSHKSKLPIPYRDSKITRILQES